MPSYLFICVLLLLFVEKIVEAIISKEVSSQAYYCRSLILPSNIDIMITSTTERRCPNGHEITSLPLRRRRSMSNLSDNVAIICKTCDSPIQDTAWSCVECSFDMCAACFSSPVPTEKLMLLRLVVQDLERQPQQACCMATIANAGDMAEVARSGGRYNGRRPNYQGIRGSSVDF